MTNPDLDNWLAFTAWNPSYWDVMASCDLDQISGLVDTLGRSDAAW